MSVLVYFYCENGRVKKIEIEIKPADGDSFKLVVDSSPSIIDSAASKLNRENLRLFLRTALEMRRQIFLAERVSLSLFKVTEQESKELFKEEIDKNKIKDVILAKAKKFFPQPA